jgi:hypothetical protein
MIITQASVHGMLPQIIPMPTVVVVVLFFIDQITLLRKAQGPLLVDCSLY